MSTRLEQAFLQAAKLPESDQDAFAEFLLAELHDEQEWREQFASKPDVLSMLADEARDELSRGITQPIEDLLK